MRINGKNEAKGETRFKIGKDILGSKMAELGRKQCEESKNNK